MYSRMYSRHLLLLAITNFVLTFTLTDAIDRNSLTAV